MKSQPKPAKVKQQHWMCVDTWELVEERRELKCVGAEVQELNDYNAKIQAAWCRDRNSVLKNICDELEQHAVKHETKDLHTKIRIITRQLYILNIKLDQLLFV